MEGWKFLKVPVFKPPRALIEEQDKCVTAFVLEMCLETKKSPDTYSLLKVNYTRHVLKNGDNRSLLSASIMFTALPQILQRCGIIHFR